MALGTLTIDLQANTAKLERDLGKANRLAEKSSSEMERRVRKVKNIALGLGGGLTIAATAIFRYFDDVSRRLDDLAKTSDKLGVLPERLAGIQYAGELTGVGIEKTNMALQRMVRRVAEAAKGTGEAVGALKELNLDAAELNALSPDKQFSMLADAMAKVENQGDRVRLAMKLFDSEGVALVNTLSLGADGLERMQREAEDLGLSLSRADLKKIEEARDNMTRLAEAGKGLGNSFAVNLAPFVDLVTEKLIESSKRARETFETTSTLMRFLADGASAELFGPAFDDEVRQLEKIQRIQQKISEIENNAPVKYSPEQQEKLIAGLQAEINEIEKLIDFNRELAASKRDVEGSGSTSRSFVYSTEDLNRYNSALEKEAKLLDGLLEKEKEREKLFQNAEDYALSIERRIALMGKEGEVQSLLFEIEKGRFKDLSPAMKENLLLHAQRLDYLEDEADAIEQLKMVEEELLSPIERLNRAHERRLEMLKASGVSGGRFDELAEKSKQKLDEDIKAMEDRVKDSEDTLSEFAKRAAQNMQDTLADFFFDPIGNSMEDTIDRFGQMLRRMAAEAAAAKVFEWIGQWGQNNQGAGGALGALGSVASLFAGGFDSGGLIPAGRFGLVGERGPELITGPAAVTGRAETAQMLGGVNIGQVVFPGVTDERSARKAAGQFHRELQGLMSGGGRYS